MITFELVTLGGVKFTEDVHEVTLPTQNGEIAVFTHHMPLVSLISPGVIAIRRTEKTSDKDMELFAVTAGIIEIEEGRVRVLVDEADHSDEVVAKEAEEALAAAQELARQAPNSKSLSEAMSQIAVQRSRLKIAELKKNRHQRQRPH